MNKIVLKVVIIGQSLTGKQIFMKLLLNPSLINDRLLLKCKLEKNIDGLNFPILIEDIAGQEKYEYINSIYYNNADGIILMYNIDNKSSFDCIVNILNMNYIDLISNNRQLLLIGIR